VDGGRRRPTALGRADLEDGLDDADLRVDGRVAEQTRSEALR
jgi:hypothetical protein